MKYKDIFRTDQPANHAFGWSVRVRFKGESQSKFFADKKNGGKNISLLAALGWRNKTWAKLGKPMTEKRVAVVPRNNTGVVGVRLEERLNVYEVNWSKPDGNQGKTSVSIRKHGKKKAFKRACKIRTLKEAERIGN